MISVNKIEATHPEKMMEGVTMRVVIGEKQGATHFNMRIFDVEPGFSTPWHAHWWEHEVFILQGAGLIKTEKKESLLEPGMVVFVPGNEKHQFKNTGNDLFRFMCLVPQEWLADLKHDSAPSCDACC